MTSSETTFNDEELLIWLRVEDTNLTDFAADRIEALIAARDTIGNLWAKEAAEKNVLADRCEELEAKLGEQNLLWQAYEGDLYQAYVDANEARIDAEAKLAEFRHALIWCSGSADFNEGGVARKGWLKVCAPLLKGESHD